MSAAVCVTARDHEAPANYRCGDSSVAASVHHAGPEPRPAQAQIARSQAAREPYDG